MAKYIAAGCAGMVKAGAETAMMCGADHDTCQAIIDVTVRLLLLEAVALAALMFSRLAVLLWRRERFIHAAAKSA